MFYVKRIYEPSPNFGSGLSEVLLEFQLIFLHIVTLIP